MHALEYAGKFLGIALGHRTHGTRILRLGLLDEVKAVFAALGIEGVACADILELDWRTYVTGTELIDRSLDLSADTVNLSQTLLGATVHVVKVITGLERARHHLE